jgi:uncharacterized UBP type Zn finger protein
MSSCPHLWQTLDLSSAVRVCAECVELGDTWVHLRLCLTCGNVGCCDQSVNKHASGHFAASGHPVARSIQPGEAWRWCYADEVLDDPEELEMEGADLS